MTVVKTKKSNYIVCFRNEYFKLLTFVLDSAIEKDEHPTIVSDHIDEDAGLTESIQWRSNPTESDLENNGKTAKSKSKLNKLTKSPSELTTKKRRQSTRRAVYLFLVCYRKRISLFTGFSNS
jgi:hypothetical protein